MQPPNAPTVARSSAVYTIRLPQDLKDAWTTHCDQRGERPQATLRALMREAIQQGTPSEPRQWHSRQIEGQPDEGVKARLELRLTPTEYQGVVLRAGAEGCSPQRWVVNCVRASLTQEPQFTMEVTKALWDSSTQLRAIGRNLNQVVKKINEEGTTPAALAHITALADTVQAHTQQVARLLDASLSRWTLVHESH